MINEKKLSLPGGETFRIILETATYREYRLTSRAVQAENAGALLRGAWLRMTKDSLLAGAVELTEATMLRADGYYILNAVSTCMEMIARVVPAEELYKGESE